MYGQIFAGAESDLKQATRRARYMVTHWGMSDRLGPMSFRIGEEHVFLGKEIQEQRDFSEETAHVIDEEVQRLLREADERAYHLLENNRDKLDRLVEETWPAPVRAAVWLWRQTLLAFFTSLTVAAVVMPLVAARMHVVAINGRQLSLADVDEVVAVLKAKPRDLHVVVTGRNARPELIEAADLVTEMTLVKHPFRAGVKAQRGIEF